MIFVLAVDLLQSAINEALELELIKHPIAPKGDEKYPVIQYADETTIILPACLTQADKKKKILEDYATSVRLNINIQKSMLVAINRP